MNNLGERIAKIEADLVWLKAHIENVRFWGRWIVGGVGVLVLKSLYDFIASGGLQTAVAVAGP